MEPYRQENGYEGRTDLTDNAQRLPWLPDTFGHSASVLDLDPFPDYLVDPQIQADQPRARLQQPQPQDGQYEQSPLRYASYPASHPCQPPGQAHGGQFIHGHLYAGVPYAGVPSAGGAFGQMLALPAPDWPPTLSPTRVRGAGLQGIEAGYLGGPDACSPGLGAGEPALPPGQPGSCPASQTPSQPRGLVTPSQDTDTWTYSVDVWPAQRPASSKERFVDAHIAAVQRTLVQKGYWDPPCELVPARPGREACRRYTLPRRYRDDEKSRLEFLQVFNANRPYNRALPNYRYSMSVALGYEARPFGLHTDPYPSIEDAEAAHNAGVPADEHGAFADHAVSELTNFSPNSPPQPPPDAAHHGIDLGASSPPPPDVPLTEPPAAPSAPAPAAQRTKAVPKPDREVRVTPDGMFLCSWDGCNEAVRTFSRKCEWSKHMDKHDRPYKCSVPGCEKLPGFTYSGGLLRHQREVHKQHGGPRNPLHCPHLNCKRATGKGFSRLENLNEHLRRVHTSCGERAGDDHDDAANVGPGESVAVGEKRKPDGGDLRGEVKKLHTENQELRQQLATQQDKLKMQEQRLIAMQTQMMTLQNYVSQQHASAPLHNQTPNHLASGSPGSTMLGDACDF